MKHINKESELTAARKNSGKNRNPDIVPSDINRVFLMTAVPNRNDYINAVFLHVSQTHFTYSRKMLVSTF